MSEKHIDLEKLNTIDFRMGPNIAPQPGPRSEELFYTPTQPYNVGRSFFNITDTLLGGITPQHQPLEAMRHFYNAEMQRYGIAPNVTLNKVIDPSSWSAQPPNVTDFWDWRKLNWINSEGAGSGFIGRSVDETANKRSVMGYGAAPYHQIFKGLAENQDERDRQYQEFVDFQKSLSGKTGELQLKVPSEYTDQEGGRYSELIRQSAIQNPETANKQIETQQEFENRLKNYTQSGSLGRWAATTGAEGGYLSLNSPLHRILNISGVTTGENYKLATYESGWDIFENPIHHLAKDIIDYVGQVDPNFDGSAWFNSLPLSNEIRYSMMLKGISDMSFVGAVGKNHALWTLQSMLSRSTIEEKIDSYLKNNKHLNSIYGTVIGLGADLPNLLVNDPDGVLSAVATLGTVGAGFIPNAALKSITMSAKAAKIARLGKTALSSATSISLGDLPIFLKNLSNLKKAGTIAVIGAGVNTVADLKDQNARIAFSMVGLQIPGQYHYDLGEFAIASSIGAAFGTGLFGLGVLTSKVFRRVSPPKTPDSPSGSPPVVPPQSTIGLPPDVALFVDDLVDEANTTASDKINIFPHDYDTVVPTDPSFTEIPTTVAVDTEIKFFDFGVSNTEKLAILSDVFADRVSLLPNPETNTGPTMARSPTFERVGGEGGLDYARRLLQSDALTTNLLLGSVDIPQLNELTSSNSIISPVLHLDRIKAARKILDDLRKSDTPNKLKQIRPISFELSRLERAVNNRINREVSTNPLFNSNGLTGKVSLEEQIKLLRAYKENPDLFSARNRTAAEQIELAKLGKESLTAEKVLEILSNSSIRNKIDLMMRKIKEDGSVRITDKSEISSIKSAKIYKYSDNSDGSITVTGIDQKEYKNRFGVDESDDLLFSRGRREAIEFSRTRKRTGQTKEQIENAKRSYLDLDYARSISPQHATFLDSFSKRLVQLGVPDDVIKESLRLLAASICNLKLNPTKLMEWIDERAFNEAIGESLANAQRKTPKDDGILDSKVLTIDQIPIDGVSPTRDVKNALVGKFGSVVDRLIESGRLVLTRNTSDLVTKFKQVTGRDIDEETLNSIKADKLKAEGTIRAWVIFADNRKIVDFSNIKSIEDAKKFAETKYKERMDTIPEFDGDAYMHSLKDREIAMLPPIVRGAVAEWRAGNKSEAIRSLLADVTEARKMNIAEWRNYLENVNEDFASDPNWRHYISEYLFESFSKERPNIGLPLNAAALGIVYEKVSKGEAQRFDKEYSKALLSVTDDLVQLGDSSNGWRKVPRTPTTDKDHKKRTAEVQSISSEKWCTRTYQASPYIDQGDFWVYISEGRPAVAIRFVGDDVREIQGPQNDGSIPHQHAHEVTKLVDSGLLGTLPKATELALKAATERSLLLGKLKQDGAVRLKEYPGIQLVTWRNEDALIGDEERGLDVFKASYGIVVITDKKCLITDSANVHTIVGPAYFLKSSPTLTTITGDAEFKNGLSFPELTTIGGKAFISEGVSVPALTTIGGNALISEGASVPELTTIGGYAEIRKGVSFPALTTIGGYADIRKGVSVPALTTIGGNALIREGASVPELTTIGGYADIRKGVSVPKLRTTGNTEPVELDDFDLSDVPTELSLRETDNSGGTVQGLFDKKTGTIFMVASSLSTETAPSVLAHEVTHAFATPEMKSNALDLLNARDALDDGSELKSLLATVNDRMESADAVGNASEALGYIVEEAILAGRVKGSSVIDNTFISRIVDMFGDVVGGLVRDFVAFVRVRLSDMGLKIVMTVDDMVAMSKYGMHQLGKERVFTSGAKASPIRKLMTQPIRPTGSFGVTPSDLAGTAGSARPSPYGADKFKFFLNPDLTSRSDEIVAITLHELGHIYSFVLDPQSRMDITKSYSDNVDLDLLRMIENKKNIFGYNSNHPDYSLGDVNEFFANFFESTLMGGTVESLSKLYENPFARFISSLIDFFLGTWEQLKNVDKTGAYDDLTRTIARVTQIADQISYRKHSDSANLGLVISNTERLVFDLEILPKNEFFNGLLSYSDYRKSMLHFLSGSSVLDRSQKDSATRLVTSQQDGSFSRDTFTPQFHTIANILEDDGSKTTVFYNSLRDADPDILKDLWTLLHPTATTIHKRSNKAIPVDVIVTKLISVAVLVPHRLEEFIIGHLSYKQQKTSISVPTQGTAEFNMKTMGAIIELAKISDDYKATSLGYSLPSLFVDRGSYPQLYQRFAYLGNFLAALQDRSTIGLNTESLIEQMVIKQAETGHTTLSKLAGDKPILPYLFLEDILGTLQKLYGIRIESQYSPWLKSLPSENKELINDLMSSPFIDDTVKSETILNLISSPNKPNIFKSMSDIELELEHGVELKPTIDALLFKTNLSVKQKDSALRKALKEISKDKKLSNSIISAKSLNDVAKKITVVMLESMKKQITVRKIKAQEEAVEFSKKMREDGSLPNDSGGKPKKRELPPIKSIDDVYRYLSDPESFMYSQLRFTLKRMGFKERDIEDIISNTVTLIYTPNEKNIKEKENKIKELLADGKQEDAWKMIRTYTKRQAQQLYNKTLIKKNKLKVVDKNTGELVNSDQMQPKEVPFSAFDSKDSDATGDEQFSEGDERSPTSPEALVNSGRSSKAVVDRLSYALHNSDIDMSDKMKRRAISYIRILYDEDNQNKTSAEIAELMNLLNIEQKKLTARDIDNLKSELRKVFIDNQTKEFITALDPESISDDSIEKTKAEIILLNATRSVVKNPRKAAEDIHSVKKPADTSDIQVAHNTVGEPPLVAMPIPQKAKKLDRVLYTTKLDGSSEVVPNKTVLVNEEVATSLAKTNQDPVTSQVVVKADAKTIKLTSASTFLDSIKDTPESVFTSFGLHKEDMVVELSQVNNPEHVLLSILEEQGVELVEYVKGAEIKSAVILNGDAATVTNVLDNTSDQTKIRKPEQKPTVKDKTIVVDSVVTDPEKHPILVDVKTGDSIDTNSKLEVTKSDMAELTEADKFNHEVMASRELYRENGADPKFVKDLLLKFNEVAQKLPINIGSKLPQFSKSFRDLLERAFGVYYTIASHNKKVYGVNYKSINNAFWRYFDKIIVSEMANKALPADTVTLKSIDAIIAEAAKKTSEAIQRHNARHGTSLPDFMPPPSPNDFDITVTSILLTEPNVIKLRSDSLGGKAFASIDSPITAASIVKEFGLSGDTKEQSRTSRQKVTDNFWENKAQAQNHTAHHTTMNWLSRLFRGSVTADANVFERFFTLASSIISNSSGEGKTIRSLDNILRWAASYCESGKIFTHQLVAPGTEGFKPFEACNAQNLRELIPIKEAQVKFDRAVNHYEMAKDIQLYMIRSKQSNSGILSKEEISKIIKTHKADATDSFINDVFDKAKSLQERSIEDNKILIQREVDTKWGTMKEVDEKNRYHSLTFDGASVSEKNRGDILNEMVAVRTKTLLGSETLDRVVMFALGWLQDEKGNPWSFRGKTGVAITGADIKTFEAITLKILEDKAKESGSSRYKPGTDLNKISEFQGESGRDFFSYTDANTLEIVICKLPETIKDLSPGDLAKYHETIKGDSAHVSEVWKKSPFIANTNQSVVKACMEELLDFKLRQHKYHPSIQVKEHSSAVLDMFGNGNENSGMAVKNLSWDEVFQSKALQDIVRYDFFEAHANFRLVRGFELLVQKEIDRQLGVTGVRAKEFFDSGLQTALKFSGKNSKLTEGISSGFRRIAEDYGQYAGMLHPLNSSYNTVGTQVSRLGTSLIKATSGLKWGLRSLAETGILITEDFAHVEIRDGINGLFTALATYFHRFSNSVEERAAIEDLAFGMKQSMWEYERLLGEEAGSASPKLKNSGRGGTGIWSGTSSWRGKLGKTSEGSNLLVKIAEVIGNLGVELGGSRYQMRGARRISFNAITKKLAKYINSGAAMKLFELLDLPENRVRMAEAQKLAASSKKGSMEIDKIYKDLARKAGFGSRWDIAMKFSKFNLLDKNKLEALKFAFDSIGSGKTNRVDLEQLRNFMYNYARNGTNGISGSVLTEAYHSLAYAIETLVTTDGWLSESRGLNRDLSIRARTPLGQFVGKLLQWSQSFSSNILQNIGAHRPLSFLVKAGILYTAYVYISDLLLDKIAGRDNEDIKKELHDPATVVVRMMSSLPVLGRFQGGMTAGLAGISSLTGGTFSGFGDPIMPPAIGVSANYIRKAKKSIGELASGEVDTIEEGLFHVGNILPYNNIFNGSPIAIPAIILQELDYIEEENMFGKYLKLVQRSGHQRNKYNVRKRLVASPNQWRKSSMTDLEQKKLDRRNLDERHKEVIKAIQRNKQILESNKGVSSILSDRLKTM